MTTALQHQVSREKKCACTCEMIVPNAQALSFHLLWEELSIADTTLFHLPFPCSPLHICLILLGASPHMPCCTPSSPLACFTCQTPGKIPAGSAASFFLLFIHSPAPPPSSSMPVPLGQPILLASTPISDIGPENRELSAKHLNNWCCPSWGRPAWGSFLCACLSFPPLFLLLLLSGTTSCIHSLLQHTSWLSSRPSMDGWKVPCEAQVQPCNKLPSQGHPWQQHCLGGHQLHRGNSTQS